MIESRAEDSIYIYIIRIGKSSDLDLIHKQGSKDTSKLQLCHVGHGYFKYSQVTFYIFNLYFLNFYSNTNGNITIIRTQPPPQQQQQSLICIQ